MAQGNSKGGGLIKDRFIQNTSWGTKMEERALEVATGRKKARKKKQQGWGFETKGKELGVSPVSRTTTVKGFDGKGSKLSHKD